MTPTADELGFTLIPPDDVGLSEADDLAAAEAAALDMPAQPEPDEPREPLGMSWVFDFENHRFIRSGSAPAETRERGALQQWCLMALHSARYAHAAFSDDFGFENPDDELGATTIVSDDFRVRARDALMVHDRIVDVQIECVYDPTVGILYVTQLLVVTDDDQALDFGDVAVPIQTDTLAYGS